MRDEAIEVQSGVGENVQLTRNLARNNGANVFDLWTKGKSKLAKLLSLTYLADFVSVYLAELRAVNPEITDNINLVKLENISEFKRAGA